MKNKKLYAAVITAALVVSAFGSTVMAADPTGTTNFTYQPGTAGPTDPIDPTDPENDPNNWMVSYPRSISLTDNNEAAQNALAADAKGVGKQLGFYIYQAVPGENGDQVNENNIGANGISITATESSDTAWSNSTEDIKLKTTEGSEVTMNLISADEAGNAYVKKGDKIDTFTATGGTGVHDTTTGYAVLKNGSVKSAVEGATYTGTVTFTFAKVQP